MKKKQQYRKSTINNTNASQQNSGEVLNSVNYQTLLEDYLNKISFSNRQFIDELKTEHNKKLKELENKVSSLEQTNHVQQQDISRLNIL
ncbi:TPA: capsule biosynthesis protein, partial [Mannheimia haemolytica]|nr:capsule biosynthesis protein [Mannheimia haemolytica]